MVLKTTKIGLHIIPLLIKENAETILSNNSKITMVKELLMLYSLDIPYLLLDYSIFDIYLLDFVCDIAVCCNFFVICF